LRSILRTLGNTIRRPNCKLRPSKIALSTQEPALSQKFALICQRHDVATSIGSYFPAKREGPFHSREGGVKRIRGRFSQPFDIPVDIAFNQSCIPSVAGKYRYLDR